jgi:hypothetical protein
MISVETDNKGQVFVHADAEGLAALAASIERLSRQIAQGLSDHEHFMTPDWSGSELDNTLQTTDPGWSVVHHLKIFAWSDERPVARETAR